MGAFRFVGRDVDRDERSHPDLDERRHSILTTKGFSSLPRFVFSFWLDLSVEMPPSPKRVNSRRVGGKRLRVRRRASGSVGDRRTLLSSREDKTLTKPDTFSLLILEERKWETWKEDERQGRPSWVGDSQRIQT